MSFLDRLLGRRADPTMNWAPFSLPIPEYDLAEMRFGSLRFGDGLDCAAFLGRPDQFEWTLPDYRELLYASGGFQLEFEKGRLAYIAFFIGPDDLLPRHKALKFSQPRLCGVMPDAIRLSSDCDRAFLERTFGPAYSIDADPDETILYYTRQNVTMEFEIEGKTGRLKRYNLYPK